VTRWMVCERPNGAQRKQHMARQPLRVSQRIARAELRVATIATARDANVRALVA
jgi:hypothetical protein